MPVLLVVLWLAKRDKAILDTGREFIFKRGLIGALGGIWAMMPDVDYFLDEPLFDGAWADIFLLHRSFDAVLPETDLFFAAEMFLVFTIVNLFALAFTVRSFERVNTALFGLRKEEDEEEDDSSEE